MTKPLKRLTTDRTASNSSMQKVFSNWDSKELWRGTNYWAKSQKRKPSVITKQEQTIPTPTTQYSSTKPSQYTDYGDDVQYGDYGNESTPQYGNTYDANISLDSPQYNGYGRTNEPQYDEDTDLVNIDNTQYDNGIAYGSQYGMDDDLADIEDSQYSQYGNQYIEDSYKQGIADQNYLTQYNDKVDSPQYGANEEQQYFNDDNYEEDLDDYIAPQYQQYSNDNTMYANNYDNPSYSKGYDNSMYNTGYEEDQNEVLSQYNQQQYTNDEEQNDISNAYQYDEQQEDEDAGYYKNNQQFDDDGNVIQYNDVTQYDSQHSINPNIVNSELEKNIEQQIQGLQYNINANEEDDEDAGYYKNNQQFNEYGDEVQYDHNEVLQNDINNAMQQYQEQQQLSTELDKDIEEEAQKLTTEQQNIKDEIDNLAKQYEENEQSQYSLIDKLNNSKYSFNDYGENGEYQDEISNMLNNDNITQYNPEPLIQDEAQYTETGVDDAYGGDSTNNNTYGENTYGESTYDNNYGNDNTNNSTNDNNYGGDNGYDNTYGADNGYDYQTNDEADLLQYNELPQYTETFKPNNMRDKEAFDVSIICKNAERLKRKELDFKTAAYSIFGIVVLIILFALCICWYKNRILSSPVKTGPPTVRDVMKPSIPTK